MAVKLSLTRRLLLVLLPTKLQALLSMLLAAAIIAAAQIGPILTFLGVTDIALAVTARQLHDRFAGVLASSAASSLALITFWATVGLVAYLVCWSIFNALIEARNEVTLETQYTNRGHWKGPIETLAMKAIGGVAFIVAVTLLKPGLALWLALAAPAFSVHGALDYLALAGAVLGLALQLYLVYACVLLTISPWYREEAFTDVRP